MNINNKNFESWNEEMAKKYNPEKYHKSPNFIIRFIENKRVARIIDFLNPQKSDTIIELGCGAGDIMQNIKHAQELWGIDLSDFMLKLAQQKKYKVPVKFIKANIEEFSKKIIDLKFDKIYCSEVLEHVENPDIVLKQIKKISKKDSIIVVSIPNEKLINKIKMILQKLRLFTLFFPNISKKMDDEWHLHSFDLSKLKEIINQDYIIEKIKRIPYGFLPLRYVVKLKIKND
ncbi:class I SAM-dependent methyltransferase [Patescibacteria group bacterium]|nr:class I SAM-dependent methyltransferase [Patescibacteria group bacterium]